jgi:hypothetical protein
MKVGCIWCGLLQGPHKNFPGNLLTKFYPISGPRTRAPAPPRAAALGVIKDNAPQGRSTCTRHWGTSIIRTRILGLRVQ